MRGGRVARIDDWGEEGGGGGGGGGGMRQTAEEVVTSVQDVFGARHRCQTS